MQRTPTLGCTVGLTACVVLAAAVGCSSPADSTGNGAGQGGTTGTGGTTAGTGGTSAGTGGVTTGQGGAAGSAVAGAMAYWISPTGVDTNLGTMAAPFKTLARALTLTRPGTTVWVMPGTYPMTATVRMTSAAGPTAPIRIWATGARPVFDFATQARGSRGFEMSGYYYHLKGLELANAGDNCILLSGSNNTVEDVVTHHCEDTGIQITVSSDQATNSALGANNLILNCDSYGNFDMATNGENADGFAAKLRIGPGNIFRGCRAWNNADDGYDLFAADDVVVIDRCWAFLNGIRVAGDGNTAGDGNGFKLGGAPVGPGEGGAVHTVTGDAAFDNRTCGFTRNNNPDVPTLSNCGVNGNRNDYCDLSCASPHAVTTTGAAAKTMPRNADGSLPTL